MGNGNTSKNDCRKLRRICHGLRSHLEGLGSSASSDDECSDSGDEYLDSGSVGCPIVEIEIPDSVTKIGDACFYRCHSLSWVTFGSSSLLQVVGKSCFSETMLVEISIPNSVTKLGRRCFHNCKHLSRVTISPSSSITEFGTEAFSGFPDENGGGGCPITEIFIPDSVHLIGRECLYRCKQLQQVTFGSCPSIHRVGAAAFCETPIYTRENFEVFARHVERNIGKCLSDDCKKRGSDFFVW